MKLVLLLLGSVVADFACQHPDLEISCVTNLSGYESLRDDLDLAVIVSRGRWMTVTTSPVIW